MGTAARTAVVAGTASAVVGHSQQKQQAKAEQAAEAQAANDAQTQAQIDASVQEAMAAQAPMAPPVAAAPVADAGPSMLDQLTQLGELKAAGVLSEEEFAAAKAKILAS